MQSNNLFFFSVYATLTYCTSFRSDVKNIIEQRPNDCSQRVNSTDQYKSLVFNASDWNSHDTDADIESAPSVVSYSHARFQAPSANAAASPPIQLPSPDAEQHTTSHSPSLSSRAPVEVQELSALSSLSQTIPSLVDELEGETDAGLTTSSALQSLDPSPNLSAADRFGPWTQTESFESTEKLDIESSRSDGSRTTQTPQFSLDSKLGPTYSAVQTSKPMSTSAQNSEFVSASRKEKNECFVEYECRERVTPMEREFLARAATDVRRTSVLIPVFYPPGPTGPQGPPGMKGDRGPAGASPQGTMIEPSISIGTSRAPYQISRTKIASIILELNSQLCLLKESTGSGLGPRRGRKAMTAFYAALNNASGVSAANDIVFDRVLTNLGDDFDPATVRNLRV